MKIISLTMVGNESEIIESFIRYNSHFIDRFMIVSTCCIDHTLDIIRNLIKEGYDIELIEEPEIAFEQRYLDNKYLKKIAREEDADFVIPLDADEFLTGEEHPRKILESLCSDRVYEVKWKNYAMHVSDDGNETFIPKRVKHHSAAFAGNHISKVIIPVNQIIPKRLVLETGHHHVMGRQITVEELHNLRLAHYPCTSKEQYLLKMYGNSIKFITWMNRGNGEASHINAQLMKLEAGADIYKIANGYGLESDEVTDLIEDGLDLSYCEESRLEIKYAKLAKVNLIHSLNRIGQLMAIKAYHLEMDKVKGVIAPTVLIFGTGVGADHLLDGIAENLVHVRAYIDNDLEKKFSMYNKRLVITPDDIRFFPYDKIIISSRLYFDEMMACLIENGVPKEAICGVEFLLDLAMEEENR